MILCDDSIRDRNIVEPFHERKKSESGMSYGVGPASYDIRAANGVTILPKKFVNIAAVEHVTMPEDVGALVLVKSTWMRDGVLVGNGWLDPGFEGHPTIMLVNHSDEVITVRPLDPIAQLIFMPTDKPCGVPYGGKYQGQSAVPVAAIYSTAEPLFEDDAA